MKTWFCSLVAAALMVASPAWAWPDKPVTLLVPFPPGGSTDTLARAMGAKLQEQLGQTFVVDNKPGATGTIGAGQVKRSPPDGYTLLVSSLGPFVIAPHLIKAVPYDPARDFDLLMVAVQAPNVLVVPAASPYKTVADVLAELRKNPGKMSFASSGNGSSDHLTAELFWQQTGTTGLHIPYKGGAPAMSDLLGGQVDATFMNINTGFTQIKAGKLRALAITSNKRSPLLPDDIKAKLHGALVAALNDPSVKDKLVAIGFEIVANSPQEFTAFQASEFARWKKVIEVGKITAD